MATPLAITGASLLTAAGPGGDAAWEALCAGRSALAPDPDPELAGFSPVLTARCAPIDPAGLGAGRRDTRIMDRHTHMLLACAADSLRQAALDAGRPAGGGRLEGEEIAFFAAMDMVDPRDGDIMPAVAASAGAEGRIETSRFFAEGMGRIPPLWPLVMLNSTAFSQVAIRFGLRGENALFSPGPEATARALAEAADSLRVGRARAALVAGVSAVISPRALARHLREAGEGEGAALGEGPALGEGAAAIVLEPPGDFPGGGAPGGAASSATPLGFLTGCGSATARKGREGLRRAVRAAAEAALG
ncbi:MAG: beta-ketoacyl synthase N-terminal-like domain-containing protein, partial [bacterium]